MLRGILAREGVTIGRRRVATMMTRMGVEAIYRKQNTSNPHPGAQDLSLSLAWAEGRSSEPDLGNGHHLHPDGAPLCVSDRLVQPRVLSYRVSIAIEADFYVEALPSMLIAVSLAIRTPVKASLVNWLS
jgi:putative transposase